MIEAVVRPSERRNCDFSFMNIFSWRFLYDTEIAFHEGWLLFRFKVDGHLAYQLPLGGSDYRPIVEALLADAERLGHPLLMLGVCEQELPAVKAVLPDHYFAIAQRDYADYLYRHEALATLSGKRLQAKRNFANRFERLYPDHEILPLGPEHFVECLQLDTEWGKSKANTSPEAAYADERRSLEEVFSHWGELDAHGIVLRVGGRVVAFTYGTPINYDTFDVCMEKADTSYEGVYAAVNRAFARTIPAGYCYLNREEDLGLEGLRRAKLSYCPERLLQKYAIMANRRQAESNQTCLNCRGAKEEDEVNHPLGV